MSTLVAITYRDEATARDALRALSDMQRQELIQIADAIIATHDGDKVRLDQSVNLAASGALGGAVWGGLIGLIFFVPVVGLVAGAAAGALGGKLSDYGIDDSFAKELGEKIKPGEAALILLARSDAPDRVAEELRKHDFGGEIIYTNMSADAEQQLRESVSRTTPAPGDSSHEGDRIDH